MERNSKPQFEPLRPTFFCFVFNSVKECNGSLLEVPITACSRAIITKLQESI